MKINIDKKKKLFELINLWVPLSFSIPLMIIEMVSMIIQLHLPLAYNWVVFFISGIVIFYFGREYYKWSFHEIFKLKKIGMSTLITISTWLSFFYSTYILIDQTITFANTGIYMGITSFFEVGATIIAIVNLGDFISLKIQNKSKKDIDKIFEFEISKSWKLDKEKNIFEEIFTKDLKIDDLIQIKRAEKIPIDGINVDKTTEVDESLLTGEINPICKKINDPLISGSINLGSTFIMKVSSSFDNSYLQKIIYNLKNLDDKKLKSIRIVDKVSFWFTPVVLLCGILAFLLQVFVPNILEISNNAGLFGNVFLPNLNEPWEKGLYFFIATIAISCPCAIGIAAPIAVLIGVGKGAKNGILFNNANIFEKIKKINVIAFDKTGTLTEGKLKVTSFYGEKNNLEIVRKMESISMHPLAKSFIEYSNENNILESKIKLNIEEIIGEGIFANDKKYIICSFKKALEKKYKISEKIEKDISLENYEKEKSTIINSIAFVIDNVIENLILFEDKIRTDAIKIISIFEKRKIEICIISGDTKENVEKTAKALGIKKYYYEMKPKSKSKIISEIQNENKKVAYVGDGINDLLALKQADISFSMTNDNEAAKAVADVNLLDLNISNIYKTIFLTRQTRMAIISNLLWAFGYNIIVIPLAILGFIPAILGVYIMAISDVTVNLNSLIFKMTRIKKIK